MSDTSGSWNGRRPPADRSAASPSHTPSADRITAASPDPGPVPGRRILVVDDDAALRTLVQAVLTHDGHEVALAEDGREGLDRLDEFQPDLIVCDINMPTMDGFTFVEHLRADATHRWLPLIFLTTRRGLDDVVQGLALGADDYVTKPFEASELLARVRGKLARPPVPVELLPIDRASGLLSAGRFDEELAREHGRAVRGGSDGVLAILQLSELPGVRLRLGTGVADELVRQVGRRILGLTRPLDLVARHGDDDLAVLLPETSAADAHRRLLAIQERITAEPVEVRGERLRVTPSVGFVTLAEDPEAATVTSRAWTAAGHAVAHLDLLPHTALDRRHGRRGRGPSRGSDRRAQRQPPRTPLRPVPHPDPDRDEPGRRLRAAVPPVLAPGCGGDRHHPGRVPGGGDRAGDHRGPDPARGVVRPEGRRTTRRAGGAGTTGERHHRRVPAQRGRHDRGDRRGVPGPGLPGRAADHRRLQHPDPAAGGAGSRGAGGG
ncbi:MAG: response regulator [Nitriliruptoraceae bacterium]|nr:response regulator [Nitriliruptoraceae bacterium]